MLQILGRSPDHGFDEPLGLLSDCHRRIEHFLGVFERVAREFRNCALSAAAAEAVRTARRYFSHAAPKHTADEEESLFPRMKIAAHARGASCEAVDRLNSDHQEANGLHARADALFEEWLREGLLSAPQTQELLELLERLRTLYEAHIRVEDHEVFPLAAELLSAEELASVGHEMRNRRGIPAASTGTSR